MKIRPHTLFFITNLTWAASLCLAAETQRPVKFYRNPMNPAITSPTPAKDNMGMDYIPVYGDENSASTVAGRASVSLNPIQVQNLSLEKYRVALQPLTEELSVSARVVNGSSVVLQALEIDARKLRVGQKFVFFSPGYNQKFSGRISSLDSALDPMSRTLRVTGSLNSNSDLKAESSGVARVLIDLGPGILVPSNSVVRTGVDDIVYLIQDNKILPRKVRIGAQLAHGYQILDGIHEGDEISGSANFLIDSEAKIRGLAP